MTTPQNETHQFSDLPPADPRELSDAGQPLVDAAQGKNAFHKNRMIQVIAAGLLLLFLFMALLPGEKNSPELTSENSEATSNNVAPEVFPQHDPRSSILLIRSPFDGKFLISAPLTYYRKQEDNWTLANISVLSKEVLPDDKRALYFHIDEIPPTDKLVVVEREIFARHINKKVFWRAIESIWEDYFKIVRTEDDPVAYRMVAQGKFFPKQVIVIRDVKGDMRQDPADPSDYAEIFREVFELP